MISIFRLKKHFPLPPTMLEERWKKIESLFNQAVELPEEDWEIFLQNNCGKDLEIVREVRELLSEDEKGNNFLEEPILTAGYNILAENANGVTLLEGRNISSYKIIRFLGNGGMGAVYLAEDERLNRQVALKILVPSFTTDDVVTRFKQEAMVASAISHPTIAHIYEYNYIDGTYFIAMEYIEGETLRQVLKKNKLEVAETIKIALQILTALAAAHEKGIVHLDIKPENIIVRNNNEIKILDFGLAQVIGSSKLNEEKNFILNDGLLLGTVPYLSPEQIRQEEVDHRTDLWSLGVVIFEMLTGVRPFSGSSKIKTLNNILSGKIERTDKLGRNVHSDLYGVILRCLENKQEERFQTAEELVSALRAVRVPNPVFKSKFLGHLEN